MGNASTKDVVGAVDAANITKLEKIFEAKPELIDALNDEVSYLSQYYIYLLFCFAFVLLD